MVVVVEWILSKATTCEPMLSKEAFTMASNSAILLLTSTGMFVHICINPSPLNTNPLFPFLSLHGHPLTQMA